MRNVLHLSFVSHTDWNHEEELGPPIQDFYDYQGVFCTSLCDCHTIV